MLAIVAGFVIHVPYSTISPGEAVSLPPLVSVQGAQTFSGARADIRLLFVRERNHVSVWRYVQARLDPDVDIFKDAVLNPDNRSQQELNGEAEQEMADAKTAATAVALTAAGYKVTVAPGLTVSDLEVGLPAEKVLDFGDVITSVNGKKITGAQQLTDAIQRGKVGDRVTLGIVRDGKTMSVQVPIGEKDQHKFIGVVLTPRFNFPVKVNVDTASIGGPSAGLAMTLAILDDLTPGNLTGGKRVAVTGTIDAQGNVGEIGAINQKAVAARAAGAQLFIVPACDQKDDPPAQLQSCQKDLQRAVAARGQEGEGRRGLHVCASAAGAAQQRRRPGVHDDHRAAPDVGLPVQRTPARVMVPWLFVAERLRWRRAEDACPAYRGSWGIPMHDTERRQRVISSTPHLSPDDVAARTFGSKVRGYSENEVRSFLKRVAEELTEAHAREAQLEAAVDALEEQLRAPRPLSEQELLDALGEETARLLRSAREASDDIRNKAEERASRIVEDALAQAEHARAEAADVLAANTARRGGEGGRDRRRRRSARRRGALDREQRRRADRRRGAPSGPRDARGGRSRRASACSAISYGGARCLHGQIEELRTGRDHLLDAYRTVKRTFLEATEALAQVEVRAAEERTIGAGTDRCRDRGRRRDRCPRRGADRDRSARCRHGHRRDAAHRRGRG